jgi:hypothetical protein
MSQTIRASDISLYDLEAQFGLQRTFEDKFFSEWQGNLPEITDIGKTYLIV